MTLNNERLEGIRKRAETAVGNHEHRSVYPGKAYEVVAKDVPVLLAEIDRLSSTVRRIAELEGNPYNPHSGAIIAREALYIARGALNDD
jgi:hypothetical protein